jgi:hypothetical protein
MSSHPASGVEEWRLITHYTSLRCPTQPGGTVNVFEAERLLAADADDRKAALAEK